jgi:Amt family ammonium transporter
VKEFSLVHLSNGLLTGLVAVTGAADDIATWAALLFGIFGGLTYTVIANILVSVRIDDPIDAIPVHFGGGLIGTILTAFFV